MSDKPAAGDLAQWRQEAEALIDNSGIGRLSPTLRLLRAHLAAMPAQDVNTELLGALRRICDVHIHAFEMEQEARAAIAKAEKGAER